MKFLSEYPLHSDADGGAFVVPANIAAFARVAEEAGLDGLAFTDHPAPSKKWLERGGHETFEPFVALGFCAAVTTRMRLMTHLTVVPYRNPLLMAKEMTTVDVLSGGRATFALGTGYLRSEFAALGVDFDERNELFDEAVEVLLGIWSDDDFKYEGKHFTALGQIIKPGPVQKPHPPLWIGGNAKIVRERVARFAQGWAPMLGGPVLTNTTRTRPISTDAEFKALIDELGDMLEANGRGRHDIDIAGGSLDNRPGPDASAEEQIDNLGRLAEMGVTWTTFPYPRSSLAAALDGLRKFGEEVAAKVR